MHGVLLSCFAVQSRFHLGYRDNFISQYLSCQVYSERGFFRIETFEHIGLPVPTHCSPFPSKRFAMTTYRLQIAASALDFAFIILSSHTPSAASLETLAAASV